MLDLMTEHSARPCACSRGASHRISSVTATRVTGNRGLYGFIGYSYFNVCTGSSLAARLAGYKPANRLTTIENAMAAPINHGGRIHTASAGSGVQWQQWPT